MYETFYGLTEKPFNLTPDPRYLFLSEKHKEAFAHLMFGIKNRCGFVMVSGEIGTGKTTICRSLLNQLDEGTEIAVILNPCLSPEELLRKINEDFGIDTKAESIKGLIDELNDYLLERNAQGKNCVLLIDEAQNLPPSILEQVRLLSNIETETQKLLQIVLVGQPELAQHLELPELRQLNQRITARYHLKALDLAETMQYIAHRLRQAGGRKKVRFTRGAIGVVYKVSGGTPRVINAVCDRALLIGFTKEAREITAAIVRQAAREIRGEPVRVRRRLADIFRPFLPNPGMLTTVLVGLVIVLLFMPGGYLDRRIGLFGGSGEAAGGGAAMARAQGEAAATPAMTEAIKTAVESTVHAILKQDEPVTDPSKGTPWDGMEATAARNAAVAGVLRAWNMAVLGQTAAGDTVEALAEFAKKNGLTCEALTPALDQILAVNLPALVQVKSKDRTIWTALLGAKDTMLSLSGADGKSVSVTRDAFRQMYAGQALILWKDEQPDSKLLKRPMKGPEVERLQKDLASVGRLAPPPSGVFDAETGKAVAKIQAETGLEVDGVAGRQIRMVLNSWMAGVATPALSGNKDVLEVPQAADRSATAAATVEPKSSPATAAQASAASAASAVPPPAPTETPVAAPSTPSGDSPASQPVLELPATSTPGKATGEPLAKVRKEELPPASRADLLPPLKMALPREVTPPLGGVAILGDSEATKGKDSL